MYVLKKLGRQGPFGNPPQVLLRQGNQSHRREQVLQQKLLPLQLQRGYLGWVCKIHHGIDHYFPPGIDTIWVLICCLIKHTYIYGIIWCYWLFVEEIVQFFSWLLQHIGFRWVKRKPAHSLTRFGRNLVVWKVRMIYRVQTFWKRHRDCLRRVTPTCCLATLKITSWQLTYLSITKMSAWVNPTQFCRF